ncbi:MAG: EamA family transporter [Nitrospirae bacterium]|nr:EamA family transporter [Nitrospirota bacterium]
MTGYIKIITAILLWSSLGIFIRKIGIPNEGIVFYSSAIAGLFQLSLLTLTGRLGASYKSDTGSYKLLIFVLLPVFSLANVLLFYFAFTHTTIANAVLTHYTAPIFVALTAPFFLREKILKATWLAIALSSFGLWLILGAPSPYEWASMNENERNGIIAGASSGLAYAFIILILRKIALHYSSIAVICAQNSVIALLLLPVMLKSGPFPLHAIPYLAFMGIVHSTIAPVLYVQGFRSVKANEAAILGYLEPVGAIILALIFLREEPGLHALLGGALILCSGYLIMRAKKE